MGGFSKKIKSFVGNFLKGNNNQMTDNSNDLNILKKMFPKNNFIRSDNKYINTNQQIDYETSGKTYNIEKKLYGTFITPGEKELLVIVTRPREELVHVARFYHAYFSVFDKTGKFLKSDVLQLRTDEGDYAFYKGRKLTYVLLVGIRTYQGWSTWRVDLWKAGAQWEKIWTLKEPADEVRVSAPAKIIKNGLEVYKRITWKGVGLIPEWKLEYDYKLHWDGNKEKFIKINKK